MIHYPAYSLYTLPRVLPGCQSWYNTAPMLHSRDITEGKLFNNLSAAVDTRHFSTASLSLLFIGEKLFYVLKLEELYCKVFICHH